MKKIFKKKQLSIITALCIAGVLAGCGKKIDYSLPADPIAFNTDTYVSPSDSEDTFRSIEYNGRIYIPFGTQKGNITADDLGECLGYVVQDGEKLEDSRIFLLAGDHDANFLGEFSTQNFMNPPMFLRAIDTLGEDITIPSFVEDLGYDYWKGTKPMEEEVLEDTDSEDEDAVSDEESEEEIETSPFALWEFEGYVDECFDYTWVAEFFDCDYDDDGRNDRINRVWYRDEEKAVYTIEFGNGDKLVVPESWETAFPHVQAGDLDGDGANEILVTLTYDTGTDPNSFAEMWLFDKDEAAGEYNEVKLPLDEFEGGSKGFEILYDAPDDENIVHYEIPGYGFSAEAGLSHDYITFWWTEEAATEVRVVYNAEIVDGEETVIRCYLTPFPREGYVLTFDITYNNGKYEIGEIEEGTFY